jgi:peptidoglycan/xylan/chitin deacetylase (PgdA/CDA1 family)
VAEPVVLAYHALSPYPNPLSADTACFADQMRTLLRKGWRPVLFRDVVAGRAPHQSFAVTFDDGFRSVYDRGRPVLNELAVPATVFLPTARIGLDEPLCWPGLTPHPMPADEMLPMSWDQVRELVADGWEVGSHTLTHPRLPSTPADRQRVELRESRQVCAAQTGQPCTSLAYPFGEADRGVVSAAQEAGYSGAATMAKLPLTGPLAVPRIGVYSHDTHTRFAVKVSRPLRTKAAARALHLAHALR